MGILHLSGDLTGRPTGNTAKALEEFNLVIRLDERNSVAYYYRGRIYFTNFVGGEGEAYRDLALHDLNQAIAIDPKNPEPYYYRGLLTQNIDDFWLSVESYERLIELEPSTWWLYTQLASARTIYLGLSQLETDGCMWKLAPDALVESDCPINWEEVDLSQPLAEHTRAIGLCPYAPIAYAQRAVLYSHMGECGLARADFEIARSLSPNPGAMESIQEVEELNIADCFARQGTDK